MQPTLRQLVDLIKSTNFGGTRNIELKILAALLYFFGLSSETSESSFEEISNESVRIIQSQA